MIVSTGTKNLQEQLMEKDIPFLQSIMPKKFAAAYMKGRNNYLCLQRFHRSGDSPVLNGLEEMDYFEEVTHWARATETGDRAELAYLPENLSFWRHIDARSETCSGQKLVGNPCGSCAGPLDQPKPIRRPRAIPATSPFCRMG